MTREKFSSLSKYKNMSLDDKESMFKWRTGIFSTVTCVHTWNIAEAYLFMVEYVLKGPSGQIRSAPTLVPLESQRLVHTSL
jgi:hypothetical protein